ncbi:hypothetical protein [Spiroplasma endosymbiont of Seladonia tumulorum]|uniref:hypothetical protein n=1 Tax=Spiroplasma endosymbiont of Seladonia tumulorum TaxID=3066321 RepID=UPI0030CC3F76
MKKLLSLLSVLTISGTAVPTTIAASPYQKEEKLNSDINYSKTNNLKILSRSKRGNPIQFKAAKGMAYDNSKHITKEAAEKNLGIFTKVATGAACGLAGTFVSGPVSGALLGAACGGIS